MTPAEFAEAHGLSLEEAELILRAREEKLVQAAVAEYKAKHEPSRLEKAMEALAKAQKKTGVHPVQEGYFDDLHRVHDPEAETALQRFYKEDRKPSWKVRNAWQCDSNGYPYDQNEGGADE